MEVTWEDFNPFAAPKAKAAGGEREANSSRSGGNNNLHDDNASENGSDVFDFAEGREASNGRRRKCVLVLLATILLAAIVGIAVGVSNNNKPNSSSSSSSGTDGRTSMSSVEAEAAPPVATATSCVGTVSEMFTPMLQIKMGSDEWLDEDQALMLEKAVLDSFNVATGNCTTDPQSRWAFSAEVTNQAMVKSGTATVRQAGLATAVDGGSESVVVGVRVGISCVGCTEETSYTAAEAASLVAFESMEVVEVTVESTDEYGDSQSDVAYDSGTVRFVSFRFDSFGA